MAKFDPDLWPASWILELIAQGNLHAFYVSGWWKDLRREVRKEQRGRCYACQRKTPAVNRRGLNVHHVNPVRERPDLALSRVDEYGRINLVCLCDSCHWDRHHQRKAVRIPERW